MPELRGQFHDPGFLAVNYQPILFRLLLQTVQKFQQLLPGPGDCVGVIGITAVSFDRLDDLGIIVQPVGVDDADVLRRLGADVHTLPEHFLAGQERWIHAVVQHRVDFSGHHRLDLLVSEARDVLLEGLEDERQQHLSDGQRLRIFDFALQERLEHLQALVVRDVGIIAGEVHQEDVSLVGAVLHEILMQSSLEAATMESHALALL